MTVPIHPPTGPTLAEEIALGADFDQGLGPLGLLLRAAVDEGPTSFQLSAERTTSGEVTFYAMTRTHGRRVYHPTLDITIDHVLALIQAIKSPSSAPISDIAWGENHIFKGVLELGFRDMELRLHIMSCAKNALDCQITSPMGFDHTLNHERWNAAKEQAELRGSVAYPTKRAPLGRRI